MNDPIIFGPRTRAQLLKEAALHEQVAQNALPRYGRAAIYQPRLDWAKQLRELALTLEPRKEI